MSVRRRRCLGALAAALLSVRGGRHARARDGAPPRVASLTPWIVETLLAIGIEPVAVPEVARRHPGWETARFATTPVDLGLVGEPNLELLDRLGLDFILIDALLQGPAWQRLMAPIAPVIMGAVYSERRAPLAAARAEALRFGEILECPAAARGFVDDADRAMTEARQILRGRGDRPVFVVRLIDARNVMIHCGGSIFHDVLTGLGLADASATANGWGFLTTGIETLAAVPDARIVHFSPVPRAARRLLERDSLWSRLPSVRQGLTTAIPELYAWGGLPTARRFAWLLAEHLPSEERGE